MITTEFTSSENGTAKLLKIQKFWNCVSLYFAGLYYYRWPVCIHL